MFLRKLVLTVLLFSTLYGSSFGGFVISIGSQNSANPSAAPIFDPGTTGVMGVYATNTFGTTANIEGFLLGIDLSAFKGLDGFSIPNVINNFSAGSNANVTFGDSTILGSNPNFDYAVNGDFTLSPIAVGAGNTVKLFDISLGISGSAPPGGQYGVFVRQDSSAGATPVGSISYNMNAGPLFLNFANNPNDFSTNIGGFRSEFTITAVPEVSPMIPMALLGAAAGVFRLRSRWKKKTIASASKV